MAVRYGKIASHSVEKLRLALGGGGGYNAFDFAAIWFLNQKINNEDEVIGISLKTIKKISATTF